MSRAVPHHDIDPKAASVEIINIAASCDIGRELDVRVIAEDLSIATYSSGYNAALVRPDTDSESGLVIVFRSGKTIIRGGKSMATLHSTFEAWIDAFDAVGVPHDDPQLQVDNVVVIGNVGRSLDLHAVTLGLGLTVAEYEPEQFAGVIYRLPDRSEVALLFDSGKVLVCGAPTLSAAQEAFETVKRRLDDVVPPRDEPDPAEPPGG